MKSLARRRDQKRKVRLQLEDLESRIVPTYALSGDAWPSPQLITISFVPDGTIVGTTSTGPVYSNLFSALDKIYGSPAVWEGIILKAAQNWAQATNINFAVVSDSGAGIGQTAYQQGDPTVGDIRIGGYALANGYLGQAYMPPPVNNFSLAGDIQLNTATTWKYNGKGTDDLFTVAEHEIGHALGLYHSNLSQDVMYSGYTTAKPTLAPDDVNGIEAIYSNSQPRSQDAYNSNGASNGTVASAANISTLVDPNALTALIQNLEIDNPTQAEYFTVTAPQNSTGTLNVTVQSTGLSLLTPALTVYDSNGTTVLGSVTSAGNLNGATLSINLSGVTPGHQYYIEVTGADSTVMSTGTYAMTLNFGSNPNPTVPLPNTSMLNGTPLHGGGGQALESGDVNTAALVQASQETGFTFQSLLSMINDEADALSASPAIDSNLDNLVADITKPSTHGSDSLSKSIESSLLTSLTTIPGLVSPPSSGTTSTSNPGKTSEPPTSTGTGSESSGKTSSSTSSETTVKPAPTSNLWSDLTADFFANHS